MRLRCMARSHDGKIGLEKTLGKITDRPTEALEHPCEHPKTHAETIPVSARFAVRPALGDEALDAEETQQSSEVVAMNQ